MLADPALYAFTGGEPPTLAKLRDALRGAGRGPRPTTARQWHNWIVRTLDTDEAVGYVQATVTDRGAWRDRRAVAGPWRASEAARRWSAAGARRRRRRHPGHDASRGCSRRALTLTVGTASDCRTSDHAASARRSRRNLGRRLAATDDRLRDRTARSGVLGGLDQRRPILIGQRPRCDRAARATGRLGGRRDLGRVGVPHRSAGAARSTSTGMITAPAPRIPSAV